MNTTTVNSEDLQQLISRMASLSSELETLKKDNIELRKQFVDCTENNARLEQRINDIASKAYAEYSKVDTISSEAIKKKDIVSIVVESVGVAGGIGAVAGGVFLCTLPVSGVVAVPLMIGGVSVMGISGVLLGKDAHKFHETNSIIKKANEKEIKMSFNQARNFIESDPTAVSPPQRHVDIMLENAEVICIKQEDIIPLT